MPTAISFEASDEKELSNGTQGHAQTHAQSEADVKERLPDSELAYSLEERRLVRKLDWRILPILSFMYLFAFLDRSNLGNARIMGLPGDVLGGDPSGVLYDWVTSAFYFTYILCELPATVLFKLFPPRLWISACAIGWGLCSTLMAATFNPGSIITTRIFLGAFEAAFAPAVPLYLSYFYTKHEIGLRIAYWFGFAAVAGAFGGFIAFGLQYVNPVHLGFSQWRLLFIIEGIPAILIGIIGVFFLLDRPEMTPYFTQPEREIALERMTRSTSGDTGLVINRTHVRWALTDWRVYMAGVAYFCLICALASIGAFLPTIILTFGYYAITQLLTVPPYAVAAATNIILAYISDRIQHRGFFMVASSFVGGIGYLILMIVPDNLHARYFAVFCITAGTYTTLGLTIAWFTHNLGSESKRAGGIALFALIGQGGSVLGSHLFPKTEEPRYIKGFAVSCALEMFASIIYLILSASYFIENRLRDRLYGVPTPDAKVDTSELADRAHNFRYIT